MPNYIEYQKSISKEFKALENRVRNLIDNSNWAEEGRYKEAILKNYLKRILPNNLSVGTGFVRNGNDITTQIDIIIYKNNLPLLFSDGDFIIAAPSNVVAIIEVKTTIIPHELNEIVTKANNNGLIIRSGYGGNLFNGIFSYNGVANDKYFDAFDTIDMTKIVEKQHWNQPYSNFLNCCVNHISIDEDTFIKFWPHNIDHDDNFFAEYSIYELKEGLGIAYFLSNLQEYLIRNELGEYSSVLDTHYTSLYYPIPEGKEIYKKKSFIKKY